MAARWFDHARQCWVYPDRSTSTAESEPGYADPPEEPVRLADILDQIGPY